jgi:hypothetical protein
MKRKLLIPSIALSLPSVFAAVACSPGTDTNVGGTTVGGSSAGTGPAPGSSPTAGSAGVSTAAGGSGGAATGGNGGAPAGGVASGGGGASTGGGGASTGGGGGASSGGGGGASSGGGGNLVDVVTGTKNANGFAFKDAFYLVPCLQEAAQDCLTLIGNCPTAPNFEDSGFTFKEDFAIGGEVGKTYLVTIQVNGITEAKYYTGGVRRDGANFATAQSATGADGWYVGGQSTGGGYNVYKLTVLSPGGTTEVQHYYLNSFPQASGFETHISMALGYSATIEVPGGGVIRTLNEDSNCRAINNCGPGQFSGTCAAPRTVPNEPNLVIPTMYGGKSVASMNVVNGAAQPYHSQVVHVTVTNVTLKP